MGTFDRWKYSLYNSIWFNKNLTIPNYELASNLQHSKRMNVKVNRPIIVSYQPYDLNTAKYGFQTINIKNDIPSQKGKGLNGNTSITIFDNKNVKIVRNYEWDKGRLVSERHDIITPFSKGKISEASYMLPNDKGVKVSYFSNKNVKSIRHYINNIPVQI
jgi:hypothetical protein